MYKTLNKCEREKVILCLDKVDLCNTHIICSLAVEKIYL